jgi:hypothetical protein
MVETRERRLGAGAIFRDIPARSSTGRRPWSELAEIERIAEHPPEALVLPAGEEGTDPTRDVPAELGRSLAQSSLGLLLGRGLIHVVGRVRWRGLECLAETSALVDQAVEVRPDLFELIGVEPQSTDHLGPGQRRDALSLELELA